MYRNVQVLGTISVSAMPMFMKSRAWTPEEIAFLEARHDDSLPSVVEAMAEHGFERRTSESVRKKRQKLRGASLRQTDEYVDRVTATPDGFEVVRHRLPERIVTLEDLYNVLGIDESLFELDGKFTSKAYEMGIKDAKGRLVRTTLYSISARFVRRSGVNIRDAIQRTLTQMIPPPGPWPAPAKPHANDLLFELMIPDLHVGKRAQPGDADYGVDTALHLYKAAVSTLTSKLVEMPSRTLLVIGNDMLHFDNEAGTTTKGTPVDASARLTDVYVRTFDMLRDVVLFLTRNVSAVDVVCMPGNHDRLTSWCLIHSLSSYFSTNEHVTVDVSATPRIYYRHNEVLLGFTHGDREKTSELPMLMAGERAADWGATRYREWHLGHLHHTRAKHVGTVAHTPMAVEDGGVIIRHFPSLSAVDAWHAGRGYVHALRRAVGMLWDGQYGLMSEHVAPINLLQK